MSPLTEPQLQQHSRFNEWFSSPLGYSVAEEFTQQFQPVLEYLKGDTLLQLGLCGENMWLPALQFANKWIASPISTPEVQLVSTFNQLPIQRNSIECVLAPLTLEPYPNVYGLIDEIDRVLKPMGYVVFLSINPWSLWGAVLKCGMLSCFDRRTVKLRTPFTLNRIFLQRGYRQCALNNFYYIPPVNNKTVLKKFIVFDEIGKMIWPFPSGFYCYIAQKYEAIAPALMPEPLLQPIKEEFKSALQPAPMNYLFE